MRRILIALMLLSAGCALSWSAVADQLVHGYTRRNGTYVQPYHRSDPDGTVQNNFDYNGNVNPYNGKFGTKRYPHDVTSPFYVGPDSHGRTAMATKAL